MMVFYRGARIARLSELAGRRIGVGAPGSGSHALAMVMLTANGIKGPPTTLIESAAGVLEKEFAEKKIDVLFLMGDSAPLALIQALMRNPDVQLYHFTQAEGYVRHRDMRFLNRIVFPRGAIDLATDLPAQDVVLVGPTIELVATRKLNSAISDVLLGAARDRHGSAGLMAKRGEFPAPIEQVIPVSDDAKRYYKSGEGIIYRLIDQFFLASLINRLLVAIVPLILVIIPAIRLLPIVYRWSVQLRILRCYRPLLKLEYETQENLTAERARGFLARLDEIEHEVNHLKVPASFAYQFYALQGHVALVRTRIAATASRGV